LAPGRVQVTTGSGVEFAPRVHLQKIAALGLIRDQFPVLRHTLPPSASALGLLREKQRVVTALSSVSHLC